jgi:hypothetical protein
LDLPPTWTPSPTNIPFQKKRIGLEDDSVAISPIYAAPELFVKPDRAPFAFDVFSAALIFCQVMFNYLDVRTDAAFHQQIQDAQYDLDAWLSRELSSKVRPAGLEDALDYLQQRPGLWKLLTGCSSGRSRATNRLAGGIDDPEQHLGEIGGGD